MLSLGAFFSVYWQGGWRPGAELAASGLLYVKATTATFAGIVASQVGNAFACRSERLSAWTFGFGTNRLLWLAVAAEVTLLIIFLRWSPLAWIFGFAPLDYATWILICCFPPAFLAPEEMRELLWH